MDCPWRQDILQGHSDTALTIHALASPSAPNTCKIKKYYIVYVYKYEITYLNRYLINIINEIKKNNKIYYNNLDKLCVFFFF